MTTGSRDAILDVVIEVLDTEGYDALQLRAVAKQAKVGLDTVYKLFPSRDELVLEAVTRWMQEHGFSRLAPPPPGVSVRDGLTLVFRHLIEPWEKHPRMLSAYFRARNLPGGHRLDALGTEAFAEVTRPVLAGRDPEYVRDVGAIVSSVAYAAFGRFANGELEIDEVLPLVERTLRRLTEDNADLADGRP